MNFIVWLSSISKTRSKTPTWNNAELASSIERVRQFNELRLLAGLIHEHGRSAVNVSSSEVTAKSHRITSKVSATASTRGWVLSLFLAALFGVGLTMLLLPQQTGELSRGTSVARLEYVGADAKFADDHMMPRDAASLLEKGWVHLERGTVRLVFHSGAIVELTGPAKLGLDSPMRSYLEFGAAKVHAPESARDFVVATESMEVVDLGTRFEVTFDPGSREANVSVIEGLVDLHLGSRGAPRTIRPLSAGYAARVDAVGEIVEITGGDRKESEPEPHDVELLVHWNFDENDKGIMADSSGRQLNGILNKPEHARFVSGISGQALAIDDEETYIDLKKHIAGLSRSTDFTFSAWVRNPVTRLAMLFSLSGESEQHRMQFYLANRFMRFGWQNGLHFDSISGKVNAWEPDRWYHVAFTLKEGVVSLYLDGELVGAGSAGSLIGTPVMSPHLVREPSHAYIGRLHDGRQGNEAAAQSFIGELDDVQLYSGALSPQAIELLSGHAGQVWDKHKSTIE